MERIICFGDSITAGRPFPEGRRWTALVQSELDKIAPDRFEVYNRGVGGNTTQEGLARFDGEIAPLLPGWVLIEFGFNDASVPPGRRIPRCNLTAFTENLGEIVRLIKAAKGKPVLLANHPIQKERPGPQGNGRPYFQNFKPYQPAIREAAEKLRVPLIDLEKEMKNIRLDDLLAEDGLHLSLGGNRPYAASVLKGLRPLLRLK